jgi:hypothetical protein
MVRVSKKMIAPHYKHDCTACHYLGSDSCLPGEPRCNVVDLYICTQGRRPDDYCLIRRYGSEGSNYGAMPASYAGERYAMVKELAARAGFYKE